MQEKRTSQCPDCKRDKEFKVGHPHPLKYGSQFFTRRCCGYLWTVIYNGDFRWTRGMKLKVRDSQKRRTYEAGWNTPEGRHFLTTAEAQQYLNNVVGSPSFRAEFPDLKRTIKIRAHRGNVRRWSGSSYGGMIKLAASGMNERVLLHELAHEVTDRGEPDHGAKFARNFLILIEQFHSNKTAGRILREQYALKKVKAEGMRFRRPVVKVSKKIWVNGRWAIVENG